MRWIPEGMRGTRLAERVRQRGTSEPRKKICAPLSASPVSESETPTMTTVVGVLCASATATVSGAARAARNRGEETENSREVVHGADHDHEH